MATDVKDRNIKDNFKYVFDRNDDDEVIIRKSASGEFSSSGVKIGWRNTTVLVTDVASELPIFDNRNGSSIHNKSENETLYLGPDNTVTADTVVGTTSGMEVSPKNRANFDIKDKDDDANPIKIWAIAPTGKTILVKITELA